MILWATHVNTMISITSFCEWAQRLNVVVHVNLVTVEFLFNVWKHLENEMDGSNVLNVSVTARWFSGLELSPHSPKVLGSNLWTGQQFVPPVSVGSLWFLHLPPIKTWGCVSLLDLNHSWVWTVDGCLSLYVSSVFDWQVSHASRPTSAGIGSSLRLSKDEWCRWWMM